VTTLRTALRNRQLSADGVKEVLIARLQKSDEDNKLAAATAHSGLAQDNAILSLDTASIPSASTTESTTEDSAMAQAVGEANDPVGVQFAAPTAGEENKLLEIDVLGVSGAPDEDAGQNGAATCAHSEVTVDGTTEVADAGETLLPQHVAYSAAVQVPPLDMAGQNSAATCAHSEVTVDGTTEVAEAGEKLLPQQVTYSTEVQVPPLASLQTTSTSSIRVATPPTSPHSSDFENLFTELRKRDEEMKARDAKRDEEMKARDAEMKDILKALTAVCATCSASPPPTSPPTSPSNPRATLYFTRLQIIETQVPAVEQRVRNVEKVRRDEEKGQVTLRRADVLDNTFGQLDKRVVILMRDVDISFRNEVEKMKDNEASITHRKNKS
jgi:uncharacterized Fe-S cluster protein YjdI